MNKPIENFEDEKNDAMRSGNVRGSLRNFCERCSDAQLIQLAADGPTLPILLEVMKEEIELRRHREMTKHLIALRKPHWSIIPVFWFTLATMVFAGIAALPVIFGLFPTSQPANKDSSSPRQQLHSKPTIQSPLQTNSAANGVAPKTSH